MASVDSTFPTALPLSFPPEFVERISLFEDMVNRRSAMRWAEEHGLADDLRQMALLEIARIVPKFHPSLASSLDHFVGACLNNCLADCIRFLKRTHRESADRRSVQIDAESSDEDSPPTLSELKALDGPFNPVFDHLVRARASKELRDACAQLPPRQREVVNLVLRDCTDREVSEEIGVTVQSVNKTRLAAIENLRKLLPVTAGWAN